MNFPQKDILNITKFVVVIAALYLLLKTFFIPLMMSSELKDLTISLGFWGYFVVIGYTVLSHIFLPLAGTPAVLLGLSIYGLKTLMILLYVGSLISAAISFYVSRLFGRNLVVKLVGQKAIKETDELTAVEGRQVLIICRLFGFPIFEIISYAAGLTNIAFKDYFIITAIAGALVNTTAYFLLRDVNLQSEKGIMIFIVSMLVGGLIFGFLIKTYLKKKPSA